MTTWSAEEGPRPGDVILAVSKNPKWAIYATLQLISGAPSMYTHAALCLSEDTYLDHRPGGTQIRALSGLSERPAVAFSRNPLTDDQRSAIVETAREYLDSPYTFWRFGYLFGQTFHLGKKIVGALDKKCGEASICSGLILKIYAEAGVPFAGRSLDPREASPGTLSHIGSWAHYQAAPLGFLDPLTAPAEGTRVYP